MIISLTGVSREAIIKYQFITHSYKRTYTDKYFNESVLRLRDDALLKQRGGVYYLTE